MTIWSGSVPSRKHAKRARCEWKEKITTCETATSFSSVSVCDKKKSNQEPGKQEWQSRFQSAFLGSLGSRLKLKSCRGRTSWRQIRVRGACAPQTMPILPRVVQDPPAVLAIDDFLSRFRSMRGLRGHLHMTASANFVLQRNDHRVAFALEKTFEAAQQIFIDFAGDLGAFFRQFFQPRL